MHALIMPALELAPPPAVAVARRLTAPTGAEGRWAKAHVAGHLGAPMPLAEACPTADPFPAHRRPASASAKWGGFVWRRCPPSLGDAVVRPHMADSAQRNERAVVARNDMVGVDLIFRPTHEAWLSLDEPHSSVLVFFRRIDPEAGSPFAVSQATASVVVRARPRHLGSRLCRELHPAAGMTMHEAAAGTDRLAATALARHIGPPLRPNMSCSYTAVKRFPLR